MSHCQTRCFAIAVLLAVAACGDTTGSADAGPRPDASVAQDLAPRVDLAMPDLAMPDLAMPDLAPAPDLATAADLATPPDLSIPPDLTMLPDLTTLPDLTPPPDLTTLPDLMTPPDLAVLPDLLPPPPRCGAVSLDGTSSEVSAPAIAALNPSGSFTVEAWVYPTGLGNWEAIAGHWRTGTSISTSYILELDPSGHLAVEATSTGGVSNAAIATSTSTLSLDAWTHVAVTFDSTTKTFALWINGAPSGVGVVTFSSVYASSGVPFTVGEYADGRFPFAGFVDEVRLSSVARYTIAFTPAQSFAPDASTALLFHFSEGSGTTTADASSNGDTATLAGNAHFGAPAGSSCP